MGSVTPKPYKYFLFFVASLALSPIAFAQPERSIATRFTSGWWDAPALGLSEEASPREELDHKRAVLTEYIEILMRSRHGKHLVREARRRAPYFEDRITLAQNSVTETVFSRSYLLETGKEELIVENYLKLNERLSRKDLIWDLAHELTHFVYRRPPSPYSQKIMLADFIREGIEGEGGELDAFQTECLIAWELSEKINLPQHELCNRFREKSGSKAITVKRFRRREARKAFYQMGPYVREAARLRPNFPDLNDGPVVFSSSLAKVPYPLALMNEFREVRKTACANNLRKQELLALEAERDPELGRTPAAARSNLLVERDKLKQFLYANCRDHLK